MLIIAGIMFLACYMFGIISSNPIRSV